MIKIDKTKMTDSESNILYFDLKRWWDTINEMVKFYLENHEPSGYLWCDAIDYEAFRCSINRILEINLPAFNQEDHSDPDQAHQKEDEKPTD